MAASDLKVIPCDSLNDAASMVSFVYFWDLPSHECAVVFSLLLE